MVRSATVGTGHRLVCRGRSHAAQTTDGGETLVPLDHESDGEARMSNGARDAPGWPGIPPRWTSSAKSGVGTALSFASRVWFTLSHGILNEIYWPREDQACTRDMGLIVTDGGRRSIAA
jgi:hypothetical protein